MDKDCRKIQDWKFVLGFGFLKLDGSTKQSDRTPRILRSIYSVADLNSNFTGMPMIDKFHSDPRIFIFLISTLAGGTGLNLTGKRWSFPKFDSLKSFLGANKVVIFGKTWFLVLGGQSRSLFVDPNWSKMYTIHAIRLVLTV